MMRNNGKQSVYLYRTKIRYTNRRNLMLTFASTGLNVNFDSGSFLGVWAIADRGVGGMLISWNRSDRTSINV